MMRRALTLSVKDFLAGVFSDRARGARRVRGDGNASPRRACARGCAFQLYRRDVHECDHDGRLRVSARVCARLFREYAGANDLPR